MNTGPDPAVDTLTDEAWTIYQQVIAVEASWNALVDRMRATPELDQRQVAIAATDGESAFMRAVRAVARPTRRLA